MKLGFIFIFLSLNITTIAQSNEQILKWNQKVLNDEDLLTKEFKDSLIIYNFSSLWTREDNSMVFGFIGENYQRIRIKIITAKKDIRLTDSYIIYGKSMVKNNICDFHGIINIKNIRVYKNKYWATDNEYKKKGIKQQCVLIANYVFYEDSSQEHSGIFEGSLTSYLFIDSIGRVKYNDIEREVSDEYCNNQFIGTWTDYKTGTKKTCNWGDDRIPFSSEFDFGAGEFSPDDKYLKFGWQTYRDAYSTPPNKSAVQEEERKWWKK